jgi:hypothetical protein
MQACVFSSLFLSFLYSYLRDASPGSHCVFVFFLPLFMLSDTLKLTHFHLCMFLVETRSVEQLFAETRLGAEMMMMHVHLHKHTHTHTHAHSHTYTHTHTTHLVFFCRCLVETRPRGAIICGDAPGRRNDDDSRSDERARIYIPLVTRTNR